MAITYVASSVDSVGSSTPDYYKSITFSGAAQGDLLFVVGVGENYDSANSTTRAVTTTSGSTSSWTTNSPTPAASNDAECFGGWATVSSTGSVTVRVNIRNSSGGYMGVVGWLIPAAEWNSGTTPALSGISGADADGQISLELSNTSKVFYVGADWTASDPGTSNTPSGATNHTTYSDGARYAVAARSWVTQSSGTRNYGPSGLSSKDYALLTLVVREQETTDANVSASASLTATASVGGIEYVETAWNSGGSGYPDFNKSITFSNATAGDLLFVFGAADEYVYQGGGIEFARGITTTSGSTSSWTASSPSPTEHSDAEVYGGWATVTSTGSVTVQVNVKCDEFSQMGVGGWRIPAAEWTGTPSMSIISGGDADSLISLSPSANASLVLYAAADFNDSDAGSTFTPTGYNSRTVVTTSAYNVRSASWTRQASGTRNYGLSGLSSRDFNILALVVPQQNQINTAATTPAVVVPVGVASAAASNWTEGNQSDGDVGYGREEILRTDSTRNWARYDNIKLTPNLTRFSVRASNNGNATTISIRTGSTSGPVIASVAIPDTGSETVYTTATASMTGVSLNESLYLTVTSSAATWTNCCTATWFAFSDPGGVPADSTYTTQPTGATRLQAESYSAISSSTASTDTCTDTGGGQFVSSLEGDDWLRFDNVTMTGMGRIVLRYYQDNSYYSGFVDLREGSSTGPIIARITVQSTGGGSQTWKTLAADFPATLTGSKTIYLTFSDPVGQLRTNINWVQFEQQTGLNPVASLATDAVAGSTATATQATAALTTVASVDTGTAPTSRFFDLLESSVYFQVDDWTVGTDEYAEIGVLDSDSNVTITAYRDGNSNIYWRFRESAGTTVFSGNATYSATDHKFIRFREASGTVYIDRSADGISWTNLGSGAYTDEDTPTYLSQVAIQLVADSAASLVVAGINTRQMESTVSLSSTAALTTEASTPQVQSATVSESATASLTASGTVVDSATVDLSSTASLTPAGVVVDTATVDVQATASLTVSGIVVQSTTATMSSGGSGTPPLPIYIDGEQYAALTDLGGLEPCSDTGAGNNLAGWTLNGWVRWDDIYFDSTQTELQLRVANNATTATVEVREGSYTGTLLGTFNVANTGGWQTWTTITASITGLTGFHDLCFLCTNTGNLNLNWFRIQAPGDSRADCRDDTSQPSGAVRVQAESWSSQSGLGTESCSDTGGGQNLAFAGNGDYAIYNDVALTSDLSEIRMRVANDDGSHNGYVEIRTGSQTGTLIGTVWSPVTTGWQVWQTVSTRITPQSGTTTIALVFHSAAAGGPNVNWFQFQAPPSAGDPTASLITDGEVAKVTTATAATATASLTTAATVVDTATVSAQATVSLTADGAVVQSTTATASQATASLTTEATVVDTATVNLSATASLTTEAVVVDIATVNLPATASLTTEAVVVDIATGTVAGTGSLTTEATTESGGTPAELTTITASLITDATTVDEGGVGLIGQVSLTADGVVTDEDVALLQQITASLVSSGTVVSSSIATATQVVAALTASGVVTDEDAALLPQVTAELAASGTVVSVRAVTLDSAADLTVAGVVVDTTTVSCQVTAELTTVAEVTGLISSSLQATAELTSTPQKIAVTTATLSAAVSVVSAGIVTDEDAALLPQITASLTASGVVVSTRTVTVQVTAGLSGTGIVTDVATVTLSETATLTAAGVVVDTATVTEQATAALTTTALRIAVNAASVSAVAALTASGTVTSTRTATVAGVAELTSTAVVIPGGGAGVVADASLTAVATVTDLATVTVSAAGALTGTPVRGVADTGTISATPGLTGTGIVTDVATAQIGVTADLTAVGTAAGEDSAEISAVAHLTTSATVVRIGTGTVAASGALTASGVVTDAGGALLLVAAGLQTTAQQQKYCTASAQSSAMLLAVGVVQRPVTATVSALAGVVSVGVVSRIALTGVVVTTTLVVEAEVVRPAQAALSAVAQVSGDSTAEFFAASSVSVAASLVVEATFESANFISATTVLLARAVVGVPVGDVAPLIVWASSHPVVVRRGSVDPVVVRRDASLVMSQPVVVRRGSVDPVVVRRDAEDVLTTHSSLVSTVSR